MVEKSTILYLTRSDEKTLQQLLKSLRLLKHHFLDSFPYPILILHETGYSYQDVLLSSYPNITFQEIEFKPPPWVTPEHLIFKDRSRKENGLGYRNMCRFFHIGVFDYLQNYEWYWRLDTDSYITSVIPFDVFEFLVQHNQEYGYVAEISEDPVTIVGLWDFVQQYVQENDIVPQFLDKLTKDGKFRDVQIYDNFEIMKLSFIRRPEVRHFLEAVDQSGKIYEWRWGDAPLRTLALSLFMEEQKIRHFLEEFDYLHYPYTQRKGVAGRWFEGRANVDPSEWIGITSHTKKKLRAGNIGSFNMDAYQKWAETREGKLVK